MFVRVCMVSGVYVYNIYFRASGYFGFKENFASFSFKKDVVKIVGALFLAAFYLMQSKFL